jgi:hypothetical protein
MLMKGESEGRSTNPNNPGETCQETLHRSRSGLERIDNREMDMKIGRTINTKRGGFEYTAFMGQLVIAYSILVRRLNWTFHPLLCWWLYYTA